MWYATTSDMYARSLQPCQNAAPEGAEGEPRTQNAYPGPRPPARNQASTNPK